MIGITKLAEASSAAPHDKTPMTVEDKNREKVIRQSRDEYRRFLDSINRSSDRDIDRAMSRA